MHKVAIDIGSGITKAICGKKVATVSSVSGAYAGERFRLSEDTSHIVTIGTKAYCVGEPAASILPPSQREDTISKDWYRTEGYRALVFKAISEVVPSSASRVAICTGLPVLTYADSKEALISMLTGRHKFSVGKEKFDIQVRRPNVHVMPQAVGLYFEALASSNELADQPTAFIDIGTYTTGFVVVDKGHIVEFATGGETVGMHNVITAVRNSVEETTRVRIDDAAAAHFIRRGGITIQNAHHDLKPVIRNAATDIAKSLISILRKQWKDGRDLRIFVGGGGVDTFFPPIKAAFPHAEKLVETEPHLSVAKGYAHFLHGKYAQSDTNEVANA